MVGVGYGKAKEVPAAIAKGVEEAKKAFFAPGSRAPSRTPSRVRRPPAWCCCARPLPVPASSPVASVRAVLECAGIHDALSKSLGSSNQINIVHATVEALRMLEQPETVAARRGLPVEQVAPAALLKARRGPHGGERLMAQ